MFNSLDIIVEPVKPHPCCYVGSSATVQSARYTCKMFFSVKGVVI